MGAFIIEQNRGYWTGGKLPFLNSRDSVACDLMSCSCLSIETTGAVRIHCRRCGSCFLYSGDKRLATELRLQRARFTAPTQPNGPFEIHMDAGQSLSLVSRFGVAAEEIEVRSTCPPGFLWVVVTCMGRLDFLKQTVPHLISQPRCKYVLVDWSCPQGSGDWMKSAFPAAHVVQVPNYKYFNQSAARNAGAEVVPKGEWICFTDSDIIAHPTFCERMLARRERGAFVRATGPGVEGTVGTAMVNQSDWRRSGGYDDVVRRYGYDDYAYYDLLKFMGLRERVARLNPLLKHISHGDDERFGRMQVICNSSSANRKYVLLRNEEMRRRGRLLTRDERLALYNMVFPEDA